MFGSSYWSICFGFLLAKVAISTPATWGQRPLQPVGNDEPFLDKTFDDMVKATLEEYKIPGLSIAVVDGDNVYSKGYGFASLPDVDATPDTQYFTGSTTKAFTAAAAAQLVHNDSHHHDIQWTTPVHKVLRNDFALSDDYATTHTTIEDALSHRSGLGGHDLIYGLPGDTPSAVVQRMEFLPLSAEPRTTYQYCNVMYGAMTDFLETVTGMSMESILRTNFWTPLGMASTTFTLPSETATEKSKLSRGYYWDPDSSSYIPEPYLDILPISGAGATISTVNDYSLWMKALLSAAGPHENANKSSPVTPAMFHDITTPRTFVPGTRFSKGLGFVVPPVYALGWANYKAHGEIVVFHSGGLPGFGTNLYLLPERNFGVVTMGNTAGTSNEAGGVLASELIRRKLKMVKGSSVATSEIEDSLRAATEILLPRSVSGRRGQKYSVKSAVHASVPVLKPASLPLPGVLQDYAGIYTHPAYGTFNMTVTTGTASTGTESAELLQAFFERTFRVRIQLRHTTDTVFTLVAQRPHGLGDMDSDDIVWGPSEVEDERLAVFKFGLDGETVETLGLELVDEMVDMAKAKGSKAWKDGMIWFERV